MHFSSGFLCELKQNSVLSKCPYSQLRAATDPITDFLKVAEHWEPGAGVCVGKPTGGAAAVFQQTLCTHKYSHMAVRDQERRGRFMLPVTPSCRRNVLTCAGTRRYVHAWTLLVSSQLVLLCSYQVCLTAVHRREARGRGLFSRRCAGHPGGPLGPLQCPGCFFGSEHICDRRHGRGQVPETSPPCRD